MYKTIFLCIFVAFLSFSILSLSLLQQKNSEQITEKREVSNRNTEKEKTKLNSFINNELEKEVITNLKQKKVKQVHYIQKKDFVLFNEDLELLITTVKNRQKETKIKKQPNFKKVAYLTFDDGPNHLTLEILDILKKYNVKATFFMLEPNIRRNDNIVQRMVKEGHYPALHSVSHNVNKLYKGNPINVALEMEKTRKTLEQITGLDIKLTRVPYGSKPYMKKSLRDGLVKYNFKMWDWSIDSLDWKHKNNPNKIYYNVINQVKRNREVILFHDNKGTVAILEKIIIFLKDNGYELIAYDPNNHFMQNFWFDERL